MPLAMHQPTYHHILHVMLSIVGTLLMILIIISAKFWRYPLWTTNLCSRKKYLMELPPKFNTMSNCPLASLLKLMKKWVTLVGKTLKIYRRGISPICSRPSSGNLRKILFRATGSQSSRLAPTTKKDNWGLENRSLWRPYRRVVVWVRSRWGRKTRRWEISERWPKVLNPRREP